MTELKKIDQEWIDIFDDLDYARSKAIRLINTIRASLMMELSKQDCDEITHRLNDATNRVYLKLRDITEQNEDF